MSNYEAHEATQLQMFVGTKVTTVEEAEPGLLITLNDLEYIFKSEYGNNEGQLDIYCSSGEFWHGKYNTPCVRVIIE